MTNSMSNHPSGTISYFKIHCKVLYWVRVPEVKGWLGWSAGRGHELLSAPTFLLTISFIFCVHYTQPVPSVRQWETQDVLVSE